MGYFEFKTVEKATWSHFTTFPHDYSRIIKKEECTVMMDYVFKFTCEIRSKKNNCFLLIGMSPKMLEEGKRRIETQDIDLSVVNRYKNIQKQRLL